MKNFVIVATIFILSCLLLHVSSTGRPGEEGAAAARKSLIPASFLQMGGHGSSELPADSLRFEPAKVEVTEASVKLSNGFVMAEFDRQEPSLRLLAGDFLGKGEYGENTLAEKGITLDTLKDKDGAQSSAVSGAGATLHVTVLKDTPKEVIVEIKGIVDDKAHPLVSEAWTLTLTSGSRYLKLDAEGATLEELTGTRTVRSIPMRPTSIYGLYDQGTEQMKGGVEDQKYYLTTDTLPLVYTLGGWGDDDYPMAGNLSLTIERDVYPGNGLHVLSAAKQGPIYSQLIEVLDGTEVPEAKLHIWGDSSWKKPADGTKVAKGLEWKSSLRLYPNNYDFPLHTVTTNPSLPIEDLHPLLTGIYANPVGNFRNRLNSVEKGKTLPLIATTLRYPVPWYSTDFNFFDPDNYFAVWAVMIAGQPHLSDQVRQALEHTGNHLSGSGQIPHHFTWANPDFRAISGETQPGPNVFWVLTCFNYAKLTQDLEWLRGYMPTLRKATRFLFDMIDGDKGLAHVPGALMIDVFLRSQFATDTNGMLVGFFREFADAEEAVGDKAEATRLREVASKMSAAVDKYLWDEKGDDHFITQLNRDGSKRDMVDYDGNLLALAHGVTSPERAKKAFARIDGGHLSHVAPTYVSEVYYGRGDTTMGNIGDSACTMGRVAWFDALARKRYGDLETFDTVIVNRLRDDLRAWTWMHERYGSDGLPSVNRTNYYFEYPSVVSIALKELRYGINMGYGSVTIDPFGPKQFSYDVGNVRVEYSASRLLFQTPSPKLQDHMTYTVHGLPARQEYYVSVVGCNSAVGSEPVQRATSNELGTLTFDARAALGGKSCLVEARAVGRPGQGRASSTK